MGDWGYKPFQNDYALDWVTYVQQPVAEGLQSRSLDHTIPLAAAEVVIRLGEDLAPPYLLKGALDAVEAAQADHSWLKTWREPAKMRAQLRKMHAALVPMIRKKKRLYGSTEWTEAVARYGLE